MRLRSLLAAVLLSLVVTLLPAAGRHAAGADRDATGLLRPAAPPSPLARSGSAALSRDHNRLAVVARRPAARASSAENLFPGGEDALPPTTRGGPSVPQRGATAPPTRLVRRAPPARAADPSAHLAPRSPPRLP